MLTRQEFFTIALLNNTFNDMFSFTITGNKIQVLPLHPITKADYTEVFSILHEAS